MEEKELVERLVKVEQSDKSAHHRIDNLENTVQAIQNLAIAVKEIAMETKATREDVNDINGRLKTVEGKPAKNWEKLTWLIVTRNCNSSSGLFFRKNRIVGGNVYETSME